jgi:hypothetical protein
MWLFNFKYTVYFLIIALTFLIIIYYIQKNKMESYKENYQPVFCVKPSVVYQPNSAVIYDANKKQIINTGEQIPFGNDSISIDPPNPVLSSLNQSYASLPGQKLDANPNTKISPVVVPPAYDLESWRDNNLINLSMINKQSTQQDIYLSGYAVSTCCDNKINYRENYTPGQIVSPKPVEERAFIPSVNGNYRENYTPGQIVSPKPVEERAFIPSVKGNHRENYTDEKYINERYIEKDRENYENIQPNHSGWVNTQCGYNPDQVQNYLPSNLAVGNCLQDQRMREYNRNLFTQIVAPDIYTINQVNEPINSNIGISFNQQFEPVTKQRQGDQIYYTLHDPRIIEPSVEKPSEAVIAKYDNVYDPRFYGYGTSYRSYTEPVTGQTRFIYDDVNAIRMPNYVSRSKIDHLPFADKYETLQPGNEFGQSFNGMREMVQESWIADSTSFREDMQQNLMRKINSEAWQQRMYPNSYRPVGSTKRIN